MIERKMQNNRNRVSDFVRTPFVLLAIFSVLLGAVYPAVVTLITQGIMSHHADGSLIEKDEKIIGSALLGQPFTQAKYFWPRPSATTPPYNPSASAGSQMSPGNPALHAAIAQRVALLKKHDPHNKQPIPIDLVTASASGLDPHISVEAARYQVARVAKARKMKEADIEALIAEHTLPRTLGFLGEPRVNVLALNSALDKK